MSEAVAGDWASAEAVMPAEGPWVSTSAGVSGTSAPGDVPE